MKIELHKQFKVPVDGLIPLAEEITIQKERRAADNNNPFTRVQQDSDKPPASPIAAANQATAEQDEEEGE